MNWITILFCLVVIGGVYFKNQDKANEILSKLFKKKTSNGEKPTNGIEINSKLAEEMRSSEIEELNKEIYNLESKIELATIKYKEQIKEAQLKIYILASKRGGK